MTVNKTIPLAIITSLVSNECEASWGIPYYSCWILKDRVNEFTGLSHIYHKTPECNSFKETKFTIPGDVTALVLKGNTGKNTKPHQLEIIWHLLNIEKCKIDFILIHPGGGQAIEDDCKDGRDLCAGLYSLKKEDKRRFHFVDSESVPYFCYSLGGGSNEENMLGQWIEEIAKAIKCKGYKDAAENLKQLHKLLNSYKSKNYDKEELQKKKPKPCLVFKIIETVPALFFPIFIDLNGLSELSIKGSYYQKEKVMKEYLIDMLKRKEFQYYTKKLAEARFLVFGKTFETLDEHLEKFKDANLKETLLKVPGIQNDFLETFGYRAEPEIIELKDYDAKLKEAPNFMVLEFFYYLDTLIKKCHAPEGITYADVSNILDNYYGSFMNWFKKMNLSFLKLMSELNKG